MTELHACNDVLDRDLSDDEILAVVSLLNAVWPKPETVAEQVAAFPALRRRYRLSDTRDARPALRHLVWDAGELVAHALAFERAVRSDQGEIRVMALSGVCVAPAYRGEGLGDTVVRRAFQRVDSGELAVSLFQTGVPAFY